MPNNHRNASRGVRNRNRTLSEETVQIAGMTVTIMRKPIKNMYLRIKPPNAQIVISTPSRMSQAAIARFVTERKSWIEQAQRAMLQARDQQIHEGNNPNDPHSFTWNDATRKRAVQTINAQLPVLLAKWSPIIGREPTHVTLRVMTSRWGVMHAENRPHPPQPTTRSYGPQIPGIRACARKTHLWENGHGEGFQRRMSAYLPQWRQLRRELNRHVVL